MARQNVGNPKFYIDMLSFFKAQGSFETVSDPNLLGNLNPVPQYSEDLVLGGASSNRKLLSVGLDHNNRMSDGGFHNTNFKQWLGFFNHNFRDTLIQNPKVTTINADDEVVETIDSFDQICNFPSSVDTTFERSGWSMAEHIPTGAAFRKINISLESAIDESLQTLMLSSVCWGQVFQMPHSPDLQLTVTREYDGIKTQQTKGGSTLTQINHTGSPHWGNFPAWYIGSHNMADHMDANYKEKRQYGKGRKVWDLKFSYVSSDSLFPVNERIDRSNISNSDEDDSLAGYDSTDFNYQGHFADDAFDDPSFMTVVMGKTLGGALPFIFQPDGNNNSPDQFAICQIDQDSFQFKQVAHNVYDISLKIREVW